MGERSNWSQPLPRPIVISTIMSHVDSIGAAGGSFG
jgi:hypothetical protein